MDKGTARQCAAHASFVTGAKQRTMELLVSRCAARYQSSEATETPESQVDVEALEAVERDRG